jgi:teichuronic acid biosynthesis glycosyltransferase TuaH
MLTMRPQNTGHCPQRPLIVWCAGTSWSGIAGTDRQIVIALAKVADILWVDPAISPLTPGRFRHGGARWPLPRLVALNASTMRLTPGALPFHSRGILRPLTALFVRQQIRHALKKIGRIPQIVVASHLDDVLGSWGPNVLNVFYGTDDYVGGAELMGTARTRLEKEELRQLHRADTVIAVSSELIERWRTLGFTGPMALIPNGVDGENYREIEKVAPAKIDLPRPIAGFIGHLSARIDFSLLESVVAAGSSLLLVGPHNPQWEAARFRTLISHARVAWVGPIAFSELPRYLKVMDVGITPYTDSAFNRASFPLKTLEYLSAGKPAVSTDLPAVRWLASDLISVANSSNFGQVVLAAANETNDRSSIQRRVAFATSHSWTRRAEAFAKAIGIQCDRASTVPVSVSVSVSVSQE